MEYRILEPRLVLKTSTGDIVRSRGDIVKLPSEVAFQLLGEGLIEPAAEPFTCAHSLFCELKGKRWIECKRDGSRCKRGSVDWWEEWLKKRQIK